MKKLPGDYISGFVDGEGCFYINYRKETKRKRKGAPIYFRWTAYFAIMLRKDDKKILEQIKHTLECGKIFSLKNGMIWYGVQDMNDIKNKIIPFFRHYPLRAKKKHDFDLWLKAAEIIYSHKKRGADYKSSEINKLLNIRLNMKIYKSRNNKGYANMPRLDRGDYII